MRLFFILFILTTVTANAQELKGSIIDSKTGEPIMNATVYFDGTSIGTVSDLDGNFSLKKPEEITADLIISIIGYQKKRIQNPLDVDISEVKIVKKTNVLEEVVLQLDPWSRKNKARYFKEQFLGAVPEARKCEILNFDKIRLRFNPATKLLTAVCDEPIIIINKHLGYKINYDLTDFEIEFMPYESKSEDLTRRSVKTEVEYVMKGTFFLGSSFFQELETNKPTRKKRIKRREKAYLLSDLRFYRALATNELKDQGYQLYRNRVPVAISNNVRSNQFKQFSRVNFRHKNYTFLINGKYQSFFEVDGETIIDKFGNNLTSKSLIFGGYISKIKISGLLPLDYGL